ncbi:MAG: NAD(P)H-binding protein [Longimicrobiales bacterium]
MREVALPRRRLLLGLLAAGALAACGPEGDVIVVSGASGQLGGLVVEELLERGVEPERLILVSRTPEVLEEYAALGAETRFGDFTQPESLTEAYEGGDRLLLISIDTNVGAERADLHKNAVDAAVAAGIRQIVYTSFVDLDNNDSPLASDHRRTEQVIRDSGLEWTMLRNSLYMNGIVGRAARMVADGAATPSDVGVAYVTREDCAAAAAAVLASDGHEGRAYDITGPEVVFPQDIARVTSEVTGVTITVGVADSTETSATPPPGSASFAVVSTAVRDLTGRPAQSTLDFLSANRGLVLAGPR